MTETEVYYHVTFVHPVRVMLMDRSTPIVAVTCKQLEGSEQGRTDRACNARWLFPATGNPVKASVRITTTVHNIAGVVEVRDPK